MNAIGVDPSLTCTGWAAGNRKVGLIQPKMFGMPRLQMIRDQVIAVARAAQADLVVLEGYGFSSKRGNSGRVLAELGGVLRLALYENGFRYVEVPPATLKQYAAGNGNATKELMIKAARDRLAYRGNSDDEADALWLLEMANDWYATRGKPLRTASTDGSPLFSNGSPNLPPFNREALHAVKWPELRRTLDSIDDD